MAIEAEETMTIRRLANEIRQGSLSPVELARQTLDRINRAQPTLNAYITVTEELALEQARRAEREIREGRDRGPLHGIPFAAKDLFYTRGIRTTVGSKILRDFVPDHDAAVIEKLREAGAVLIGKTGLHEWAYGITSNNPHFGAIHNPWDRTRIPGGSSGGSTAALAAGLCSFSLGSDTGGSIRIPASFCGVVGLKPTYGRVSRYGLVAYASSLDQIGPFARDVRGCAEILSVIAGHDKMDATSLKWPIDAYADRLLDDIKGLRIGLPEEYFGAGLDAEVESVVKSAVDQLETAGALVVPVSLPHTKYALAAYYIIAPAEASANLSRFDGVKYGLSVDGSDIWESFAATRGRGFGAEVKRRIMIGTYALSAGYYDAYYLRAQRARTLIKRDFDDALERVDVIAGPTAPTVAFKIGEKVDDPVSMYLTDVFTVPVNVAGLPALVVPCGIAHSMPVGLQFIGPAGAESRLLNLGSAFEQITSSAQWRPKLEIPEIPAG